MRRLALSFSLLFFACGEDEVDPPAGPDPAKIFEQRVQTVSYADVPFAVETPFLFRTVDRLGDLDVRAMVRSTSTLYVGTGSGLAKLREDGEAFDGIELSTNEAVLDLAPLSNDRVAVLMRDRVQIAAPDGTDAELLVSTSTPGETFTAIAVDGDEIWIGGTNGLINLDAPPGTPIPNTRGMKIRDLVARSGAVIMATDQGAFVYDSMATALLPAMEGLADNDVRALAFSADGAALYVASATGYAKIAQIGGAAEVLRAERDGLPTDNLTAIAATNGKVLTGHAIGASVVDGTKKEHYQSLRWIPGQKVTAVVLDPDGTRWIGTDAGVSRIGYTMTTLAEKAALNEDYLEKLHWRMDGFVDDNLTIADAWDLDSEVFHSDHDNDGLWTEMQVGAWCLAYGATGDEEYYRRARKAMDVMFMQFDIPAKTFAAAGKPSGFITRSLVRDDEGEIFTNKSTQANWHLEEWEGRMYYWKDDTSSDEYAGHYYGIPLFYDLCAKTEEEKEEIRKRIRTSTDYLIDNEYVLIDLDGESTTHGHWEDLGVAAEGLDECTEDGYDIATCVSSYHGGGWLNALEILGHLLATWHMTGDQKYYDAYEKLYTEKRYGEMVKVGDQIFTLSEPSIANHSDHELATLAYYTYLRYEPNADRRKVLEDSILAFYEYEREEHHPWEIGMIGSAIDRDVDLAGAVQTLKDMPTDWRQMTYDNEHRKDADRWPRDRHQNTQFNRVFPYDEIRTMKWNANPYRIADGGNERGVLAPTPYQIAYWTMRYHGLLTGE